VTALEPRVRGALLGLATGDALTFARDAVARAPLDDDRAPALVHASTTTWALTVLDALTSPRGGLSLHEGLVARLEALASVRGGRALRGSPRDIAGTLRDVARSLAHGTSRRRCGTDRVVADAIAGTLPLAFALGDDVESVAAACVDVVALTHRHPRVVASAAMWVGGLRHALAQQETDREALLAAGQETARIALALVADAVDDARGAPMFEAEGALAMACAAAGFAEAPDELLAPIGFDGSDAPERIACASLSLLACDPDYARSLIDARMSAPDAHVVVPLLLASWGIAHGVEALPCDDDVNRLVSRDLVGARASALWEERPLPWLLEEELALPSREAPPPQTQTHTVAVAVGAARSRSREQLRLL
jgi:ADP-ribosylglycohydrolase